MIFAFFRATNLSVFKVGENAPFAFLENLSFDRGETILTDRRRIKH